MERGDASVEGRARSGDRRTTQRDMNEQDARSTLWVVTVVPELDLTFVSDGDMMAGFFEISMGCLRHRHSQVAAWLTLLTPARVALRVPKRRGLVSRLPSRLGFDRMGTAGESTPSP